MRGPRTYVALLRGINVGGHGSLKMVELRAAFESFGCADVQTYIQSGNVVFDEDQVVDSGRVEQQLADSLGRDIDVMLRTASEMAGVAAAEPFGHIDTKLHQIGFMQGSPSDGVLKALELERFAPEQCEVDGAELHMYLPNGMARAKLPVALARGLDDPMTIRNHRTVTRLAEMAKR
jgi:uncharacterized protein (DUF1697 family)